jgi:hypothetical protein
MFRKLAAGAAALAMFGLTAAPAFAWGWPTVSNFSVVHQDGSAVANTGKNFTVGGFMTMVKTGPAMATTEVYATVDQADCGCSPFSNVRNTAFVTQTGASYANSGKNTTFKGGWVTTGEAFAGTILSADVTQ